MAFLLSLARHQKRAAHRFILGAVLVSATACAGVLAPAGSLYDRLGGQPGVEDIVGALVDRLAADPATNRSFDGLDTAPLKQGIATHLCQVTGGPCRFEGGSMRDVHRDLDITEAEFARTVAILREVLDERVATREKNELLRLLAPMQRDIATGPHGHDWEALRRDPGSARD